jgi:hypothetical protein
VHPQLQAIVIELETACDRLRLLQSHVPGDVWDKQPAAGGWSVLQCIEHLNLTTEALLPTMRAARQQLVESGAVTSRRSYRFDVTGFLVWKAVAPTCRLKTRTAAAFVPAEARPGSRAFADFERLQADVQALVRACDGLPIDRVKVRSPFNGRVQFNLYAALRLIPQHQQRHLLQAENVATLCRTRPAAGVEKYSAAVAAPELPNLG